MLITKELLATEITGMEARLKDAEALMNRTIGATVVLKDLLRYAEAPEPVNAEGNREDISQENAAIQAKDEALAMTMQQLAETVAGPGATAEEPQPYYYPTEDLPVGYDEEENS